MAIEYPDLLTLDQALVDEAFDQIAQRIAEFDPTIDTKFGVFQNIVVYMNAVLSAAIQTEIQKAQNSLSLSTIQADETLDADEDLVDTVAANFRIARHAGSKATGQITIVIDAENLFAIPAGTIWTALDLNFITDSTYTIRPSGQLAQTDDDRVLVSVGTNLWAFTINVTAELDGTDYNLEADTKLTTEFEIGDFVTAYVETSFVGGVDAETNSDLANRVLSGMAIKAWSSRASIEAMIKAEEEFQSVTNVSMVGFGDAEMLRDQHTIWPGSMGGRTDIYLRTQETLASTVLTKTATLVAKTGSVGTWRFSIGRNDAPGYYEINKIVPADNTQIPGFLPSLETRDKDLTGTGYIPDIANATEAVYSPYQTATIEFIDTATNATSLTINVSTKNYQVIMSTMPYLKAIQDFMGDRDTRAPAGDALIKAPVPCFVTAGLTVEKDSTEASPDLEPIKLIVASTVNAIGFTGRIPSSSIINAVQPLLTDTMTISAVTISGRIRKPNGTSTTLVADQVLVVAADTPAMVSSRTVQFYLNPEDVAISVVNSGA